MVMIIPQEIEKQIRAELEIDLPENHFTEDTMFVDKELCDVLINSNGGQKENKEHIDRNVDKLDSNIQNGLNLNIDGEIDPIYKLELESVWARNEDCETK